MNKYSRKSVAFNPHWVGNDPAWDIVLPKGQIHRSVTKTDIKRTFGIGYIDVVREKDIQHYGNFHQGLLDVGQEVNEDLTINRARISERLDKG